MKANVPKPLKYLGEYSKNVIDAFPRPQENEYVFCTDTETYLIYAKNKEWIDYQPQTNGGLNMNLYDLNKTAVAQLPTMTEFEEVYKMIDDFDSQYQNEFYMLYGKEISYFTIFRCMFGDLKMSNEFVECLRELGEIKSIELTSDGNAIEAWVCPKDQDATVLYFFPYDSALVNCGA